MKKQPDLMLAESQRQKKVRANIGSLEKKRAVNITERIMAGEKHNHTCFRRCESDQACNHHYDAAELGHRA